MQAGGGGLGESIMGGASGGRGLLMTEMAARHMLAAVTGGWDISRYVSHPLLLMMLTNYHWHCCKDCLGSMLGSERNNHVGAPISHPFYTFDLSIFPHRLVLDQGTISGTSLFLFNLVSIVQTTQAVVLFPNIF